MSRHSTPILVSIAGLALLAGCAGGAPRAASPSEPGVRTAVIEVHKSPDCSCCHEWEAYLGAHGYTVRSVPTAELTTFKTDAGVPAATWSCHTALVDGYLVEGHVPVEAIEDLLAQRPAIAGIGLAEMPAGSPGMPGVKEGPFEVLAFADGQTSGFGSY